MLLQNIKSESQGLKMPRDSSKLASLYLMLHHLGNSVSEPELKNTLEANLCSNFEKLTYQQNSKLINMFAYNKQSNFIGEELKEVFVRFFFKACNNKDSKGFKLNDKAVGRMLMFIWNQTNNELKKEF